jgi:vacuolar-type H+-ATPase subunit H
VKQVIAEILDVEKDARRQVEEAKDKARAIRQKAEADSKSHSAAVREQALKAAQQTVAKADAEAQAEREKALGLAAQEGKSLWKDKEKEIAKAVDKLFRLVTGVESK